MLRALTLLSLIASPAFAAENYAFFEKNIRPILIERCYECHSLKEGKSKGGLVLDSRQGWQTGGDHGPAIVPGKPAESILLNAVSYRHEDLEMPPKGKLRDEQIAAIHDWIAMGAPDPREGKALAKKGIDIEAGKQFWSFQPVKNPAVPENGAPTPVDAFLQEKLTAAGLQNVEPAPPATLLRRLHFDLTGLPPTAEESAKFKPENLEKIVDALLASRQFAEKWARHWLDIARYSDSNGSSFNPPFRQAWRYRNWVIDAYENDMPYDEFVAKQIAGDLMDADSQAERDANTVATGYLMFGSKVLGLFDKEKLTMDVVDEQLDVIGQGLMGLTIGCARCHDHKFDPLPTADYYALAGIFTSTETLHRKIGSHDREDESGWSLRGLGEGGDEKLVAFMKDHRYDWMKANRAYYSAYKKLAELEKRLDHETEPPDIAKVKEQIAEARTELDEKRAELKKWQSQMPEMAMAPRDVAEPADTTIRIRGVADSHGDRVERGFLKVASFEDQPRVHPDQSGRLQLGQWLSSSEHPLTARVYVNRVWKHLFDEGIVRTVDNFGIRGEQPSHPELLDYLAHRFVHEHNWSTKALVRELVLTQAYRLSSAHSEKAAAADPENRLLWRQNRRRLEPEELRDTFLQLGGRLDPTPSYGEKLEHLGYTDLKGGDAELLEEHMDARRTIYQPVIRNMVLDVLEIFDYANPAMPTGRRPDTTVAPQALYFLNSPFVLDSASLVAEHISAAVPSREVEPVVTEASRRIWNREPTDNELEALSEYLITQFEGPPGPTDHDIAKLCQALFASTQFQYID